MGKVDASNTTETWWIFESWYSRGHRSVVALGYGDFVHFAFLICILDVAKNSPAWNILELDTLQTRLKKVSLCASAELHILTEPDPKNRS